MATIGEVKKELRYREWAEEIAECQSSGMAVKEWCRMKGLNNQKIYIPFYCNTLCFGCECYI